MSDLVERVARIIANAMGDNYSDAFKNKDRWIAKRGMSGGRFRDVNEPMQCDYLAAAQAAIAAVQADADLEQIKRERDQAVEALIDVGASLAAAISLLERSRKSAMKAAPSNLMFDQMLADYRASLSRARTTFASIEGAGHE